MTDPGVRILNKLAELALRMSEVRQKISGCFRKHGGASIYITLCADRATMHGQAGSLFERILSTVESLPVQRQLNVCDLSCQVF